MHEPLNLLLVAVAVGLVVLWWRASVEVRERANAAALEACERAGAQFLDGTVAFQRLQFARAEDGGFALRRTYAFDYTEDGHSRRHGFVILRGRDVEIVGLGPTLVAARPRALGDAAPADEERP